MLQAIPSMRTISTDMYLPHLWTPHFSENSKNKYAERWLQEILQAGYKHKHQELLQTILASENAKMSEIHRLQDRLQKLKTETRQPFPETWAGGPHQRPSERITGASQSEKSAISHEKRSADEEVSHYQKSLSVAMKIVESGQRWTVGTTAMKVVEVGGREACLPQSGTSTEWSLEKSLNVLTFL